MRWYLDMKEEATHWKCSGCDWCCYRNVRYQESCQVKYDPDTNPEDLSRYVQEKLESPELRIWVEELQVDGVAIAGIQFYEWVLIWDSREDSHWIESLRFPQFDHRGRLCFCWNDAWIIDVHHILTQSQLSPLAKEICDFLHETDCVFYRQDSQSD